MLTGRDGSIIGNLCPGTTLQDWTAQWNHRHE